MALLYIGILALVCCAPWLKSVSLVHYTFQEAQYNPTPFSTSQWLFILPQTNNENNVIFQQHADPVHFTKLIVFLRHFHSIGLGVADKSHNLHASKPMNFYFFGFVKKMCTLNQSVALKTAKDYIP